MSMTIAQTNRLQLRHIVPSDAEFLFDLYNQPAFLEHIGDRGVSSLAKAHQFVDGVLANYEKHGFWLYLVEDRQTGKSIGINGLVKRDYLGAPDMGFAISEAYWGQGYAYESSLAVLNHAKELKLEKLLAIISPDNIASIQLIEKLGFDFVKQKQLTSEKSTVNLYRIKL